MKHHRKTHQIGTNLEICHEDVLPLHNTLYCGDASAVAAAKNVSVHVVVVAANLAAHRIPLVHAGNLEPKMKSAVPLLHILSLRAWHTSPLVWDLWSWMEG